MWQLAASSPRSVILSNVELSKRGATFVMPPSSFNAYNQYSDWYAVSTTSDGGASITDADWLSLNQGQYSAIPTTFPFTNNTTWFGETPTNYILLVNMEPNSLAQSFEIEVFCQDGVRFPANSLAASMEHVPNVRPLTQENVSRLAQQGSMHFHRANPGGVA